MLNVVISNFGDDHFIFEQTGKAALSHVTRTPSLIINMWKYVFRSKISDFPSGSCQSSAILSANMQTSTSTTERAKQIPHMKENECASICTPTPSLHTGLTKYYSFNGTLTNLENKGGPWQCSCYPSPLQSCINNS